MFCDVFLVGFNPAGSGTISFWSYWSSGYGFDKKDGLLTMKPAANLQKKCESDPRAYRTRSRWPRTLQMLGNKHLWRAYAKGNSTCIKPIESVNPLSSWSQT
jgi:hypothetical protein